MIHSTRPYFLWPRWAALGLLCLGLYGPARAAQAPADLRLREEQAIKAAVAHAAPSIVRIETVGGLERVGQVLVGTGPTTGVVVSEDGYIIASAFNFAQKPASILVELPGGGRAPARLVATDHSRMLVLLKVDAAEPLAPAEAVPEEEVQVGQWAIAVGRTFEGETPNVSVGIVSAVARVWGKAIQTDAKVSPTNYGGPLLDIRGRVLGVLVPLSTEGAGGVAGAELYDSGIGFAVPLAHVLSVLPRLAEGDLHPGILGVNLKGADQFSEPAVIAACRVNSPAYQAGLQPEDRIVEIDGLPVVRQAQLKQELGRRYAGDTIHLVVLRGEKRIERDLVLIDKLQPYQHPFLGLLPLRDSADTPGVPIRYVYPDGPAARAGIEPGEVVTALDGQPVAGRDVLLERLNALADVGHVQLELRNGDAVRQVQVELGRLPEEAPGELPPARQAREAFAGELPQVGRIDLKLPEFAQDSLLYVPQAYHPEVPHGVVVWLNPTGSYDDAALADLVAHWQPLCDRYDLVLLAPKSADGARWDPAKDLPYIRKQLDQVRSVYNVDPARVVAHGYQGGGALCTMLAFAHRDAIRAVAAVEAPPAGDVVENEPIYRLAFYFALSATDAQLRPIAGGIETLRELKYPLMLKDLGAERRYLTAEELEELVRWIDTLDRM